MADITEQNLQNEEPSPSVDNTKILTKGLQSSLNSLPVQDGMLRFTTDTGRLYMDVGNDRILISEYVTIYTEAQIKNLLVPLPKIYVSSDTHRSFVFDFTALEWMDLAAINLSVSTTEDVDKPLWFTDLSGDHNPEYNANLKFNTQSGLLTAPNIKATDTIYVGNMRIQNTLNSDNTSHTVLIDFI